MSQKTILHLSCDFPDPLVQAKTRSVQNLLDNTPGFRHVVYSLNRVGGRTDIASLDFGTDRIAVAYGAPSQGILLRTFLERLADWIARDLARRRIGYDGVHAHKFSVEGLIALRLLRASPRPLICDIWGDTDLRIVSARRDLRSCWLEITRRSAAIIPCAPWAQEKFERLFGLEADKSTVLPPIVMYDTFARSAAVGRPRLVTLFNLDAYRRKNLPSLIRAVMELSRSRPDATLDIWGSGSPRTIAEIRRLIHDAGAEHRIVLRGPLSADLFRQRLADYAAFLMPTRRETFGLVFVEALFCGLPILHTRGWGVDGFFVDGEVGYACDPLSLADIKRGIETLIDDEAGFKDRLARLASRGGLRPFQRQTIVDGYRVILDRAMGGAT
jgi:glycosyltransferase involved in cell wall biosynthesis